MRPMSSRLPAALRSALAELAAGADPEDVAADIIRKRAEGVVLNASLPDGDPRQAHLDALQESIRGRTFDDSGITLDAVLRDLHERGEHAPS